MGSKELRKLIQEPSILVVPGVFDALGAKLAQEAGFQCILAGGNAVSAGLLGLPDMGLLTLSEMLDTVRRMRTVAEIPIIADIDTGGGSFLNVRRTIREMELAGASAVQIEDQVFPKKAGLTEGRLVVEPEEMVGRLKAATDARTGDLLIIARTDADDLSEAIDRANLYHEQGADVLFVEEMKTTQSMSRVVKEVQGPTLAVMVEGSKYAFLSVSELERIGFSAAYYCNSVIFAASYATRLVLHELRKNGTTQSLWEKMVMFDEYNRMIGFDAMDQLQTQYKGLQAKIRNCRVRSLSG